MTFALREMAKQQIRHRPESRALVRLWPSLGQSRAPQSTDISKMWAKPGGGRPNSGHVRPTSRNHGRTRAGLGMVRAALGRSPLRSVVQLRSEHCGRVPATVATTGTHVDGARAEALKSRRVWLENASVANTSGQVGPSLDRSRPSQGDFAQEMATQVTVKWISNVSAARSNTSAVTWSSNFGFRTFACSPIACSHSSPRNCIRRKSCRRALQRCRVWSNGSKSAPPQRLSEGRLHRKVV